MPLHRTIPAELSKVARPERYRRSVFVEIWAICQVLNSLEAGVFGRQQRRTEYGFRGSVGFARKGLAHSGF
jgi:hypothetical protein